MLTLVSRVIYGLPSGWAKQVQALPRQ